MENLYAGADSRADKLTCIVWGRGFPQARWTPSSESEDAGVTLNDEWSVQVCLDGDYLLVRQTPAGGFFFFGPYSSRKSLLEAMDEKIGEPA